MLPLMYWFKPPDHAAAASVDCRRSVGDCVAKDVGTDAGDLVGAAVEALGLEIAPAIDALVGSVVGVRVGRAVGDAFGTAVGVAVGASVGMRVVAAASDAVLTPQGGARIEMHTNAPCPIRPGARPSQDRTPRRLRNHDIEAFETANPKLRGGDGSTLTATTARRCWSTPAPTLTVIKWRSDVLQTLTVGPDGTTYEHYVGLEIRHGVDRTGVATARCMSAVAEVACRCEA